MPFWVTSEGEFRGKVRVIAKCEKCGELHYTDISCEEAKAMTVAGKDLESDVGRDSEERDKGNLG